jgi:alpha-methylacyl-CoA racemase
MSGPLSGVKILEFAGLGPAPYAAMLMADLGADIVRIERTDASSTPRVPNDLLNRSRPSWGVDLKSEAGREFVREMCSEADALIEGFRPGVMERLHLGPSDLLARNRALVYGRMTGYGQEGPLAQRAGHDINYIAVSGALWPIGRDGEAPVAPMNLVGDFGGGALFLVMGILAGVLWARETGASMVDGSASLLTMLHSFLNAGLGSEQRGVNLLDSGAHFYEAYETRDQQFMAVGAIETRFYDELLSGLGLNPADLPPQMDRAQWPAMKERFRTIFATKTTLTPACPQSFRRARRPTTPTTRRARSSRPSRSSSHSPRLGFRARPARSGTRSTRAIRFSH